VSRWAIASAGCKAEVKELALKGYWCGAMQAAKRPGLTERSMVSANQAGFNLRETDPLPRTILHSWAIDARAATGQRTRPMLLGKAKGYRGWPVMRAGTAVAAGYRLTL